MDFASLMSAEIAKAKGAAKVVASASGKNEEFVRGLGADEVSEGCDGGLWKVMTLTPSPPVHRLHEEADS